MRTSHERILTTHVGSLPRRQVVVDVLFAQDRDEPTPSFDEVIDAAVLEIVGRQKTAGVYVPSDGEMSKISYATYIRHRLGGFAIPSEPPPRATPHDLDDFSELRDALAARGGTPKYQRPVCVASVTVKNLTPLERFAGIVGRERVMAGSDCGFGTFAGFGAVHPSITFEKLASMTEGARIASGRLWA